MAQVVDYSFARPDAGVIAAAGYVGAVRYLRGRGKAITRAEQDALHAAGLAVGYVEESTASRAGEGFNAGRLDAVAANQAADALGVPSMIPIRYAVDFQTTWSKVADYFAGARSAGGRPVSVYGCYDVIEGAAAEGYGWLWQCAAWSGTGNGSGGSIQGRRLSQHAVLFQRVGYVLNDTSDVNDVLAAEWGGWHPDTSVEDDMTPEQAAQLDAIAAAVADTQAKVTDVQGWVKGNLASGIAQLVAASGDDAAQLEEALRSVLSEHYDVQLTLTPKA